jgi:hypothetical protein
MKNRENTILHLKKVARWLDRLDVVIGLVPGLGDALSLLFSLWIIYQGFQLKVGNAVILRMLFNLLLDFILGLIPFLGDMMDWFYPANLRNALLIEKALLLNRIHNQTDLKN